MRQPSNPRRARTRGNGKRHPSSKNYPVESNGPDVKIRGTAQQVLEKYLALARDAASSGDRVAAESYYQHADHYYRIVNADHGGGQGGQHRNGRYGRFSPQAAEGGQPQAAEAPLPVDAPQPDLPPAQGGDWDRERSGRGNGENPPRHVRPSGNGQSDPGAGDSADPEPTAA